MTLPAPTRRRKKEAETNGRAAPPDPTVPDADHYDADEIDE